jgi:hypothetical protein
VINHFSNQSLFSSRSKRDCDAYNGTVKLAHQPLANSNYQSPRDPIYTQYRSNMYSSDEISSEIKATLSMYLIRTPL